MRSNSGAMAIDWTATARGFETTISSFASAI
jgi:hypothetical protein